MDPVQIVVHFGVDPRSSGTATAIAVASYAQQNPLAVGFLAHHRTAAVTLHTKMQTRFTSEPQSYQWPGRINKTSAPAMLIERQR